MRKKILISLTAAILLLVVGLALRFCPCLEPSSKDLVWAKQISKIKTILNPVIIPSIIAITVPVTEKNPLIDQLKASLEGGVHEVVECVVDLPIKGVLVLGGPPKHAYLLLATIAVVLPLAGGADAWPTQVRRTAQIQVEDLAADRAAIVAFSRRRACCSSGGWPGRLLKASAPLFCRVLP